MPLPLGHTAIGITVYDLFCKKLFFSEFKKKALFILVLANLPDVDVALGLLIYGNGNTFHPGPTHSLLFALAGGLAAANTWRLWSKIPKLSFLHCFLVLLSHSLADFVLGDSTISFFWPFQIHYTEGFRGFEDVMDLIIFGGLRDAKIIAVCAVIIGIHHAVRNKFLK
jgi:membrane-bound metal-dependent hydrolase YbcI (DUF457 family)